jgi:hypothetical protein
MFVVVNYMVLRMKTIDKDCPEWPIEARYLKEVILPLSCAVLNEAVGIAEHWLHDSVGVENEGTDFVE